MDNYFSYFSEIEEHYLRRRGGGLLLSTLDWMLIETWKDGGVPLEAVLRGIDSAFDKYEQRRSKTQKVNSLAYCAQAVLTAAEDMKEAAVGASGSAYTQSASKQAREGFEPGAIADFLRRNAMAIEKANLPQKSGIGTTQIAGEIATALRKLAENVSGTRTAGKVEDLERRLTVLEERLFATLVAATPDEEILAVRTEVDRDLAPFRRKLPSSQIDQLQKQYVHKRLLEKYGAPRLSLFYM